MTTTKKGRPAAQAAAPKEAQFNEAAYQADASAATALAVARLEADTNARAVATQVGYLLPADSTDPELIARDIQANMRRSVEACLEVGRGLTVLKAACAHGEFLDRLELIGVDRTVAKRFMQAAVKFSNGATSHHLLQAAGTQSKLFELLTLDDEQIEELGANGATGDLSVDDVAAMTTKELRAAVRELRHDKQALEELGAAKNTTIDKLRAAQKKLNKLPPNEALALLQREATGAMNETLGCIEGHLRQALVQLGHEEGDHTVFMAGLVCQPLAALRALLEEFQLPDVSTAAQAEAAAAAATWAKG